MGRSIWLDINKLVGTQPNHIPSHENDRVM